MTTAQPLVARAGNVTARARAENFTVASRLLRPAIRRDLLAIYGFARLVDDTSDEAPGDRLAQLERIEADVARIYEGGEPDHPLVHRLTATVRARDLPARPLYALIEAGRRDQVQHDYETFAQLLEYCTLSANPIGHLVLAVFGAATPGRLRRSDSVCTALQLIEILQDVAEDLVAGRIYLPAEDRERFGCRPQDLRDRRAGRRVCALVEFEVARARALLEDGVALVATLQGRPAIATAGFVAGGTAALDAIELAGHDVLAGPPRATRRARLAALIATLAAARRSAGR